MLSVTVTFLLYFAKWDFNLNCDFIFSHYSSQFAFWQSHIFHNLIWYLFFFNIKVFHLSEILMQLIKLSLELNTFMNKKAWFFQELIHFSFIKRVSTHTLSSQLSPIKARCLLGYVLDCRMVRSSKQICLICKVAKIDRERWYGVIFR